MQADDVGDCGSEVGRDGGDGTDERERCFVCRQSPHSVVQRGSKGGERVREGPRTFSAVELALSSPDPFFGKQNRARILPAWIRVYDLLIPASR